MELGQAAPIWKAAVVLLLGAAVASAGVDAGVRYRSTPDVVCPPVSWTRPVVVTLGQLVIPTGQPDNGVLVLQTTAAPEVLGFCAGLPRVELVLGPGGFVDGPVVAVRKGCKAHVPVTLSVVEDPPRPGHPVHEGALWRLSRAALRIEEHVFPVRARGPLVAVLDGLAASAHPQAASFRALRDGRTLNADDPIMTDARWADVLRTTCQVTDVSLTKRGRAEAHVDCWASPAEEPQEVSWQLVDVIRDPEVAVGRVVERATTPATIDDGWKKRLAALGRGDNAVVVGVAGACTPNELDWARRYPLLGIPAGERLPAAPP